MQPMQIRLDPRMRRHVKELARRRQTSDSEALRVVLNEGMRAILLKEAIDGYLERRFSLARAARHAGLSNFEMASELAAREIPYYRYSPAELERDIETARRMLK